MPPVVGLLVDAAVGDAGRVLYGSHLPFGRQGRRVWSSLPGGKVGVRRQEGTHLGDGVTVEVNETLLATQINDDVADDLEPLYAVHMRTA